MIQMTARVKVRSEKVLVTKLTLFHFWLRSLPFHNRFPFHLCKQSLRTIISFFIFILKSAMLTHSILLVLLVFAINYLLQVRTLRTRKASQAHEHGKLFRHTPIIIQHRYFRDRLPFVTKSSCLTMYKFFCCKFMISLFFLQIYTNHSQSVILYTNHSQSGILCTNDFFCNSHSYLSNFAGLFRPFSFRFSINETSFAVIP